MDRCECSTDGLPRVGRCLGHAPRRNEGEAGAAFTRGNKRGVVDDVNVGL